MSIDDQSPPGSWANELKAAPWGYGQGRKTTIEKALAAVHGSGLWEESILLAQEISLLRTEIDRLKHDIQKGEQR